MIAGVPGQWNIFRKAVNAYAGESVKLRFTPQLQSVYLDDIGLMEKAVPGWTFTAASDAVAPGQDANGTYLAGWKSGGQIQLVSSKIDFGVPDRPNRIDGRSYVVSYDIGDGGQFPGQITVYWIPETGNAVQLFGDASTAATGFKNGRFSVYNETMTQRGSFRITVTHGKLYSIGDNVARQQLAEPFSQQVRLLPGTTVDTATGSFGTGATDLGVQGGPIPITLARTYAGHSDRRGEFGYRWTDSFDIFAAPYAGGDVAVVFGTGREEYFVWSSSALTFTALDPRVTSTLTKLGNGNYQHLSKDGTILNFYLSPTTGLLSAVQDDAGRAVAFTYDAAGHPTSQPVDPGPATHLVRDDPRLSAFSDHASEEEFAGRGLSLALRLADELGPAWNVAYYDRPVRQPHAVDPAPGEGD